MLQFNINSQETLVTQVHMHNKVVLVFHEFRVHNTAQVYTNRALVIINVNFLIVNSFFYSIWPASSPKNAKHEHCNTLNTRHECWLYLKLSVVRPIDHHPLCVSIGFCTLMNI